MEIFGQVPLQAILFFILYGVTGVVPLIAALYLLVYPGNVIAPGVTPPLRLRRWAAAFFAISALGHVWWFLFYVFYGDIRSMDDLFHSMGYWAAIILDYVTMLSTMAGMLLAMLQDRRRPVWPVFVAMIPIVALGGVLMVWPNERLMQIATIYVLLLYVLFTVYMTFAVQQYGRWLRDNYADLERKEVWLTHVASLVFMLLFILYTLVDINTILLMFLMHFTELVLFVLLLWRVETLPQLEDKTEEQEPSTPIHTSERQSTGSAVTIDLDQIEQQLKEHCKATQLYLRHDLSLQQLAQAIGTNRYYLSQYFSRQGITYNIYINNLRISYFISRYQEAAKAGQDIAAQQLAQESGFGSYRTFARAFTLRTGQNVTVWMRNRGDNNFSESSED